MLLRIRVSAVLAGHSPPQPPLRADMPSRKVPRLSYLSNRWLTVLLPATVAVVAGHQELSSIFKVLVDKCLLLLILTQDIKDTADSIHHMSRLGFPLSMVSLMLRVL